MRNFFIYFFIFFFCLGCSVGPDYQQPTFFSDAEINKNLGHTASSTFQADISKEWYTDFDDAYLNTLIAKGLSNSPNIKGAIERMKQARFQFYIQNASLLPLFDLSGQYARGIEKNSGDMSVKTDYYISGLDVSWELDIWGGQRRAAESAKALLKAAAADYKSVQLSLTAEIASQYIQFRLAQKQRQIVEQNLKLQKNIFEMVRQKYLAGLTDTLAFEQAQSALHSTEMIIPQTKIQEQAAKNALSVLIGSLPSEIKSDGENILDRKIIFDLKKLNSFQVDIIRNRPDVKVAEYQLMAQNALIGKAIANLFPNVSLSYLTGYQNKNLGQLVSSDHSIYSFDTSVSMPVLHWGSLVNQVRLSKSQMKEKLAIYQNCLYQAIADVRNAQTALKQELKRNNSARQSLRSNETILTLSRKKYETGLTDFSDVLTAEQNKLSAEQTYLQSLATIYQNIITFYKSVGGGLAVNHSTQACQTGDTNLVCAPDKDLYL